MARGQDMHTAPQQAPPGHFGTVEPGGALPCFENSDLYAFLDRLHDLRDRLIHWHAVALGTVAEAERHRPGAAVLLPGNQHEGHLLFLGGADLLREPVVPGVHLYSNTTVTQLARHRSEERRVGTEWGMRVEGGAWKG